MHCTEYHGIIGIHIFRQEHRKLEREMAEYTMAGQYLNGIGDEMQKLEAFQNRLLELRSLEDKSMQVFCSWWEQLWFNHLHFEGAQSTRTP